jgi:hypothetical protein
VPGQLVVLGGLGHQIPDLLSAMDGGSGLLD